MMCAIFGVFNVKDAARLTAIGLHNNQHRAIDYAGMVSTEKGAFHAHHGNGLARQVFTEDVLASMPGNSALGHLRYPTVSDDPQRQKIQPIIGVYNGFPFALAHNGNITNVAELKRGMNPDHFKTSMDSECIVRLLEGKDSGMLEDDLISILREVRGSYSLCILTPHKLIMCRDPEGNRPLSYAKLNGGYCFSSETCAFAAVETDTINFRDVEPGTFVSITEGGLHIRRFASQRPRQCRFEAIYYSNPASTVFDESVLQFRISVGQALGLHCPVRGGADIVSPIPDSANFIAMGYAQTANSGMYLPIILRSHYVGRTFIAPTQKMRNAEAANKFLFAADQIQGKRVVLVDDSIVRGTTLPRNVAKMRRFGATEVHVRIGSPPIRRPCRYGIDTPSEEELIASRMSVEEICAHSGADSLEFLPIDVLRTLSTNPEEFCYACMDGKYWDE